MVVKFKWNPGCHGNLVPLQVILSPAWLLQ